MRASKARSGRRAGQTCHRRWNAYGKYWPSHTQGGSRMRESRPYGSVRGACDETHVPTATAARVHLSDRRRGGGVAACGASTTTGGSDFTVSWSKATVVSPRQRLVTIDMGSLFWRVRTH